MATLNETLNVILNEKSNQAKIATNSAVAKTIWEIISEQFRSIPELELEQAETVSVQVKVQEKALHVELFVKDALAGKSERRGNHLIRLSQQKMKKVHEIMNEVIGLSMNNDIQGWYDDGKDDGIERGDGEEIYGFIWYNE